MITDTRFLTPHHETLAWWTQREKCKACRHLLTGGDTTNGLRVEGSRTEGEGAGMRCARVTQTVGTGPYCGRVINAYCIDARDEAGPCGPEGKLHASNV